MFVRYLFDDSDQVLPRNFPEFPNLALNNKQVLTVEETKIITKNIVNEARFGFNHSTPQEAVPRTSRSLALISGKDLGEVTVSPFLTSPPTAPVIATSAAKPRIG